MLFKPYEEEAFEASTGADRPIFLYRWHENHSSSCRACDVRWEEEDLAEDRWHIEDEGIDEERDEWWNDPSCHDVSLQCALCGATTDHWDAEDPEDVHWCHVLERLLRESTRPESPCCCVCGGQGWTCQCPSHGHTPVGCNHPACVQNDPDFCTLYFSLFSDEEREAATSGVCMTCALPRRECPC